MKKLKSLLYGAVCIFVFSLLLGAGAAQAQVVNKTIDFESGIGDLTPNYFEQGFRFRVLSGTNFGFFSNAGNPPPSLGIGTPEFPTAGDTISVTPIGTLGLFNFSGVQTRAPGNLSFSVDLKGYINNVETEAANNIFSTDDTTWEDLVFDWEPIDELRIIVTDSEGFSSLLFDNLDVSVVPIPGAVWLLGSGLVGVIGLRRKRPKTLT